jgi:pimeloyl-ACP methyl ester carboxylesterase
VETPEIRYAKNDGVALAYQLVGQGGPPLAYVPGFASNLELSWDNPRYARFLRRLASFSQLVIVDRRGTGLSDRLSVNDLPPIEVLVADLLAVFDDAGVERASLFGFADGADLCGLFAATHPDRTSALILYGASAVEIQTADAPWAWTPAKWQRYLEELGEGWGKREYVESVLRWAAPSAYDDPQVRSWFVTYQRLAASPAAVVAIESICRDIDMRPVLASIAVPTMVLHRTGDQIESIEGGRYLSSRIPAASFVELEGDDHLPWAGDQDGLLDEVEDFLTGTRRGPDPDRALATVLFTDIVGSTARAAALGDANWRNVLEDHYALVRTELARHRGVEIDTAGDGFFATFDGPARAVRCALAIASSSARLDLEVRAGVHTGECDLIDGRIGGIGVAIGARIGASAGASEVLVSSTVKDLTAGSGLLFEDAGEHELKGVPDRWHLYRVVG